MAQTWREQLQAELKSCMDQGVTSKGFTVQEEVADFDLSQETIVRDKIGRLNHSEFYGAVPRSLKLNGNSSKLLPNGRTVLQYFFIYNHPSMWKGNPPPVGNEVDFNDLP